MSREYASLEIANLLAARIPPDEFDRRARAPLSEDEARDIAELIKWFSRRYPSAMERLAYARRKACQYTLPAREAARAPVEKVDYLESARRLALAHRKADPETELVFLEPDPRGKEIRLLEVTRSAPTTGHPFVVGFAARPDLGVPFSLAILLLSPGEWDAVMAGRLELPDGWEKARLEPLER